VGKSAISGEMEPPAMGEPPAGLEGGDRMSTVELKMNVSRPI
jgi:hypothetical protein